MNHYCVRLPELETNNYLINACGWWGWDGYFPLTFFGHFTKAQILNFSGV